MNDSTYLLIYFDRRKVVRHSAHGL
jgi:hypothetical protein